MEDIYEAVVERKHSLLKIKNRNGSDNFQTPEWPLEMLLDAINYSEWIHEPRHNRKLCAWDPCMGKGNIVKFLQGAGFAALGSDLDQGTNFLEYQHNDFFDLLITNPPYSKKDQFLQKCYELGKPFALLMPLTALEGKKRIALYKEHGLQLLLLPKRVAFETPTGKKSSPHFATAWFTHGFGFDNDMVFL